MKIAWDKDSTAYAAVREKLFEKLSPYNGSIVVQLRIRYNEETQWREITELLIDDGEDWDHPCWVWENDWWEGEQNVELIAAADVADIKLSDEFKFTDDVSS